MAPPVEVVTVRGTFQSADAVALAEGLEAAFAAGAQWVAVDLAAADGVDLDALADATRRYGVVVCGGSDATLRVLADAGVVATRRLLDVRVAAHAGPGDGLKRRVELLALPRLTGRG